MASRLLHSQPPPQSMQQGYPPPLPPLSPDSLVNYLFSEEAMDARFRFPQNQPYANVIPAPSTPPVDFSMVQNFPEEEEKKRTAQRKRAKVLRDKMRDKTKELKQLIPGAGGLNTAEMLQAAFKYVRFMQVQDAVLEGAELEGDLLGRLLNNASIQEKLAREGLCLVPKKLVEEFAEDEAVLSCPSMAQDLRKLLH